MSFFFLIVSVWGSLVHADVYQFPDREIHISLGSQVQDYNLQLRDDESSVGLDYMPNVAAVLIPKISYKDFWSLSWGFNGSVTAEDEVLKGQTKYTDIRFDFALHKFTINTHYIQYQGMFLDNTAEADPALAASGARIQRPDLYSRSMGVSFTWVQNEERFSLPALYSQTERQERRGGSFLFGGALSEKNIRADSSLIPTNLQGEFDVLADLTGGKFQTLSVKAGYGYAWARKWFFGGAVMAGPGLARRTLRYEGRPQSKGWEPTARLELLLSWGYNGDVFFMALRSEARQDFYFLTGSSGQINPQLIAGTFNIGVHLDSLSY